MATSYVNPPQRTPPQPPVRSFGTFGSPQSQANYRATNNNLTDFGRTTLNDNPSAQYQMLQDHFQGASGFSNWLAQNAGQNYNRFVQEMAAQNNPTQTYGDWLGQQSFTADYRRLSPQERGQARGFMNPYARLV